MLDINPLSVISFANIFSRSVGCLFVLSVVSFAVQKLLSLIRSHLFIFAFISLTLRDGLEKKYCFCLVIFKTKKIGKIYTKSCRYWHIT